MAGAADLTPLDLIDVLVQMRALTDRRQVNALTAGCAAALGADRFLYEAVSRGPEPSVDIVLGQTPRRWEAHYIEHGWAARDPIVRHVLTSAAPIFWSDLTRPAGRLQPQDHEVFCEARSFGLKEGFVTPIHQPSGRVGAVVMMGETLDACDPRVRVSAELLCRAFAEAALRVSNRAAAPGAIPRLTPRECDCLLWAARGLVTKRIAALLDLMPDTVDKYIKSAMAKLSASTRVEAVARAKDAGLLAAGV